MRLSVVIPCLNAAEWLDQTLRSVLDQTRAPDEVIVVDNGSSDDSLAIAARPGVRTLECAQPGAAAARNVGLATASGDAIMFLDADDVLGPDALAALESGLVARPGGIAACPWKRLEFEHGCWVTRPPSCGDRTPGWDDLAAWLTGWYHPPCAVLWSREALARTGPWDPQISVNDDGDLMMRALAAGVPLVRTRSGTSFYRRLPGARVSLSGARFTRSGLQSRIRVNDKIVGLLEDACRLRRYRRPLALAYDAIADDCGDDHPDLSDHCRRRATTLAGSARLRARRERGRQRLISVARRLDDLRARIVPIRRTARRAEPPAPSTPLFDGPLISVIVQAGNDPAALARSVESAVSQSYRSVEVIVAESAGLQAADTLIAAGRGRVRNVRREGPESTPAARNYALHHARGEWIAFLSPGEVWPGDTLAIRAAQMAAQPGRVAMIHSPHALGEPSPPALGSQGGRDLKQLFLWGNPLAGAISGVLVLRRAISVAGGFDDRLGELAEQDLWARLAELFEFDLALTRHAGERLSLADEPGRLSFSGNMHERSAFHERHRYAMRKAGVEHLFLLESALAHGLSPSAQPVQVRRLAFAAWKARPASAFLHPALAGCLLRPAVVGGLQAALPSPKARVHSSAAEQTKGDTA